MIRHSATFGGTAGRPSVAVSNQRLTFSRRVGVELQSTPLMSG